MLVTTFSLTDPLCIARGECYSNKSLNIRALCDPHGTAPGPTPNLLPTARVPPGLLQSCPAILSSGRQTCLATGGAEEAQFHKPNLRCMAGTLMGASPDTHRG